MNEELDFILNAFVVHIRLSANELDELLRKSGRKNDWAALQFLQVEKYMEMKSEDVWKNGIRDAKQWYELTAKGKLKIENGGFAKEQQKTNDIYYFARDAKRYAKWGAIATIVSVAIMIAVELSHCNKNVNTKNNRNNQTNNGNPKKCFCF